MAVVKNALEASKVTLESKWQRYERIKRLFGIRRLGDLFPPHSTPNNAANDPLICSGDVLRDLCQIGEALKNKGVARSERIEMVKKEFREGVVVQHREIRELLARVRRNEFEERLKGMRAAVGEGEKMGVEYESGSTAAVSTDKNEFAAFIKDAHAAASRMEALDELETKETPTPGFATADQIRASFRRRSDIALQKRKRAPSQIEDTNLSPQNDHDITTTSPSKRTKPSHATITRDPLTPHTTHQIFQTTNTAPAKLASRKMMMGAEDDTNTTAKRYRDVLALVKNLVIILGNVQGKMRDDVEGAEQMLITARNLIGVHLEGGQEE